MTSQSVDLYARLAPTDAGRRLLEDFEQAQGRREGTARQAHWETEDGWLISYTTSRVQGGPHHGRFVVQALRPYGRGARTSPERWREAYRREFATRKAAKARAEALYRQHSPKYAARAAAAAERDGRSAAELIAENAARAAAVYAACAARPHGHQRGSYDPSDPEDRTCCDCGAWLGDEETP